MPRVAGPDPDPLILTITDLSNSGSGLGRDPNGRVIFVPFTAPGDEVRVRVTSTERRYAEGELVELITPSPIRVKPPCQVFGRCGGCQWQHLPYPLQWETKLKGVRHTLERRKIPWPESVAEFPAERVYEYRNRIQLRGSGGDLGFFARASNAIVKVDRCEIARPELNAAWPATREAARNLARPYKVELEVTTAGEVRSAWNAPHAAWGFRQVHDEQNERLKLFVAANLTRTEGELPPLLDLYGGTGNLSLSLAPPLREVDCVDVGAPASSPPGTPAGYRFHRAAVLPWLLRQKSDARPRAAIVDPPREGLSQELPEIEAALRRLGVNRLVAVGCDVNEWAHDLGRFLGAGWRLGKIAVLDLFPQTPHVEAVAVLSIDTP